MSYDVWLGEAGASCNNIDKFNYCTSVYWPFDTLSYQNDR